ncbi:helicase [Aureococcus anophagefferens]|nr:helicase [Aureococcus anophagefferens]
MSSRHVPIAAHRETLLWALENRSALVVVGETGCGKSTQLPKYLIEAGWAAPRVVVVDEAHERSLATDLLLGLLKKAMRALAARGDALRVVVMSATADADAFERFFGVDDTAVAVVDGRQYAADVLFAAPGADYSAGAVERAHASERRLEAAILVFCRARARSRSAAGSALRRSGPGPPRTPALHAGVAGRPQEARAGAGHGKYRKVVVATNVAETSLTIPDVAVVIDRPLPPASAWTTRRGAGDHGLLAGVGGAARGRAGRTGPGKCYRLYTEAAFASDLFRRGRASSRAS